MTTNNDIYSAMSGGKVYKTYKKTIPAKLYVTVLNMLTGTPTPEGVMLVGDPRKNDNGAMFDVFSEQEDYFFKKMNKSHFDAGRLVEVSREGEKPRERTIEEFSDEELRTLINKPFLALQSTLNKTSSVATLFRIETIARDLEKSEKVMRAIASRLAEVQEKQLPTVPEAIEEEL